MLIHHIKTVFRTLQKQKLNAVINILGLSLGLGITLFIWIFVLHELSYDRFFDDHEQIYRIHTTGILGQGEPLEVPTAIYPLGEHAVRHMPEVENYVRFTTYFMNPTVSYQDRTMNLTGIIFADSTFFDMFSLPFLAGDPGSALNDPRSLVINESSAARLFEDPLDALYKMVTIQEETFQVSGIIEDLPENTHMHFNAVGHEAFLPDQVKDSGTNFYTYLKLHPDADIQAAEDKLDQAAANHIASNHLYDGLDFTLLHELSPIAKIHLHSDRIWEMKDNGSIRNVYIFAFLSVFILLVAIINYINLATARSMLRSKEIGVRKVAGAHRYLLIRQVMTESLFITLLSFIIAFVFAEFFAAFFSRQLGLALQTGAFISWRGLLVVVPVFITTALLSGIYPAFYLSSFDAVKTLKGEVSKGTKGQLFRRMLVVFQFVITIFVISSLLVITRQIHYIQSRDMGFDQEQVLVISNLSSRLSQSYPALKADLETLPRVEAVSGAYFTFGGNNRVDLVSEVGQSKEAGVTCEIIYVDHGFFDLMDIDIVEGRSFHAGSDMDMLSAFVLNERAVSGMGLDEPLGRQLDLFGTEGPLIGIARNFHFKSLHQTIEPLAILYVQSGFPHVYLRVGPGDTRSMIVDITEVLQSFDEAYIPAIEFLDESIRLTYHQERQTASLLTAGALLAFVIALLGVYGLAAFSAERRIKETGIRIVLGSTTRQLLWVFNRESVILVAISFLIAMPLAWYAMEQWLNNFAYRITINPLWFLFSGLIVLALSSLIISLQAWMTARANPVNSLKYE